MLQQVTSCDMQRQNSIAVTQGKLFHPVCRPFCPLQTNTKPVPRSMGHLCGPGPWTTPRTQSRPLHGPTLSINHPVDPAHGSPQGPPRGPGSWTTKQINPNFRKQTVLVSVIVRPPHGIIHRLVFMAFNVHFLTSMKLKLIIIGRQGQGKFSNHFSNMYCI